MVHNMKAQKAMFKRTGILFQLPHCVNHMVQFFFSFADLGKVGLPFPYSCGSPWQYSPAPRAPAPDDRPLHNAFHPQRNQDAQHHREHVK